jgi:hypothetical protein
MPQLYMRFKRGDEVLEPELEFLDLESARQAAVKAAKALLSECIKTGRDPSHDAVLVLNESGVEVESIALLDTLGHVVRDRVEQENSVARVPKSGPSVWSWLRR